MSTSGTAMRLSPRPKYLALMRMAVQQAAAYRANLMLNMLANLTWVAVLYYLWRAVFADRSQIGGFGWDEMRTYVLVTYAVNSLMSFSNEGQMAFLIRTGQIAVELTRPLDFQTAQIAQLIGSAVIEGMIGMIFALTLGIAILDAQFPVSWVAGLAFVGSVGLGFLVKALIGYLTGLLSFWTTNVNGLRWARAAITDVFSGALIPLALFPDWLRTVTLLSPFQTIINTPLTIYLGHVEGWAIVGALGVQALWIGLLWLLARQLWIPAVRTLTIQGG